MAAKVTGWEDEVSSVVDRRIMRVKLYPLLVHEIISLIQKFTLDDMPITIRTMRTRSKQMEILLLFWKDFGTEEECSEYLGVLGLS